MYLLYFELCKCLKARNIVIGIFQDAYCLVGSNLKLVNKDKRKLNVFMSDNTYLFFLKHSVWAGWYTLYSCIYWPWTVYLLLGTLHLSYNRWKRRRADIIVSTLPQAILPVQVCSNFFVFTILPFSDKIENWKSYV